MAQGILSVRISVLLASPFLCQQSMFFGVLGSQGWDEPVWLFSDCSQAPHVRVKACFESRLYLLFLPRACMSVQCSRTGVSHTHFHRGPHQPHGCLQRAEMILGLCKCDYSLTVKELRLHCATDVLAYFWSTCKATT